MADDTPQEKPRGDQMTTDFFENVLASYLEEDRLESGVLRLETDDGRTRRLIIDDDTGDLDRYEYIKRELAEVIYLIEENEDLLNEPVEQGGFLGTRAFAGHIQLAIQGGQYLRANRVPGIGLDALDVALGFGGGVDLQRPKIRGYQRGFVG